MPEGTLARLFQDLVKNKDRYLGSKKGCDFEDRIEAELAGNHLGYTRIRPGDVDENKFSDLKREILQKCGAQVPRNPFLEYKKAFFREPYNSQSYPDFLILDGNKAFSVEVKFNKKGHKPMWNGGLPRPNGIYVLGSYERRDITFFVGECILELDEVMKLHDFFEKLRKLSDQFNYEKMSEQRYGFCVDIRNTFAQSRKNNNQAFLNFFDNPSRQTLELHTVDYLHR